MITTFQTRIKEPASLPRGQDAYESTGTTGDAGSCAHRGDEQGGGGLRVWVPGDDPRSRGDMAAVAGIHR